MMALDTCALSCCDLNQHLSLLSVWAAAASNSVILVIIFVSNRHMQASKQLMLLSAQHAGLIMYHRQRNSLARRSLLEAPPATSPAAADGCGTARLAGLCSPQDCSRSNIGGSSCSGGGSPDGASDDEEYFSGLEEPSMESVVSGGVMHWQGDGKVLSTVGWPCAMAPHLLHSSLVHIRGVAADGQLMRNHEASPPGPSPGG